MRPSSANTFRKGVSQTSIQDDFERELQRLKLEKYRSTVAQAIGLDLRENRRVKSEEAAALADGELAPEEKSAILGRLDESGLGDDRVRQIHQDLVLPPSAAELAKQVASPEGREAVFRCAALVILADGKVADLERSWLDRLARAFDLDEGRKQALEREIFE